MFTIDLRHYFTNISLYLSSNYHKWHIIVKLPIIFILNLKYFDGDDIAD